MRKIYDQCRRLSEHEGFESLVLFLILTSSALMAVETVPEINGQWDAWLYWLNHGIQWIFVVEIAVRILACGPRFRTFFTSRSNVFDFTVVLFSLLPGVGPFALAARLLRLLRVLRLLTVSDRLRAFLDRLSGAFDEAAFGAAIVAILGFIFTLGGHYLFGEIDPGRWGGFSSSARTVFYLLLAQDVPACVGPLLVTSRLNLLYFLVFYFAFVSLFISVLAAAVADAVLRRPRG